MFKIWLDDERSAPIGWVACRWPEEVIELLKTGEVEEISLDHDLSDSPIDISIKERTGYDVLTWIEEQVIVNSFVPPKINIHTANASARKKMLAAVTSIEKHKEK